MEDDKAVVAQPAGEATEQPAAEAEKFDPTERISSLESELAREREARKAEAQGISKKEAENIRLRKQLEEREADKEYMKILAASIAELQGKSEGEFDEEAKAKKPDLLKKFEELEQKRAFEKDAQKAVEIQRQVESLGYTEDDIEYEEVRSAVVNRQFKLAEMKIGKLQPKAKAEIPPVVDEVARKKEIDEAARKILEGKGLLKTDAGTVAGTGSLGIPTNLEKFKEWIGNIPQKDYEEKYAATVKEMMRSGKIK